MVHCVREPRDNRITGGTDPGAVADLVVKVLLSRNPRPSYYIGKNARLLVTLNRILPERWIDGFVRMNYYRI